MTMLAGEDRDCSNFFLYVYLYHHLNALYGKYDPLIQNANDKREIVLLYSTKEKKRRTDQPDHCIRNPEFLSAKHAVNINTSFCFYPNLRKEAIDF